MQKLAFLVMILFGLSGCTTFKAPTYTPTKSNSESIEGSDVGFYVEALQPRFEDTGSIMCRGVGPVETPGQTTFSRYIQSALESELRTAGLWDGDGKRIVMQLAQVDFSSTLGATNWYINAHYTIAGTQTEIATTYHDRSSYLGTKACNNMALYLPKAVSEHFSQLFQSGAFLEAVRPLRSQQDASDGTLSDRLSELEAARDAGLITADEYATKRKVILDEL